MKKADLRQFSDFGFLILKWKNVGREVHEPRDRWGNILIKGSNLFIYHLMVHSKQHENTEEPQFRMRRIFNERVIWSETRRASWSIYNLAAVHHLAHLYSRVPVFQNACVDESEFT